MAVMPSSHFHVRVNVNAIMWQCSVTMRHCSLSLASCSVAQMCLRIRSTHATAAGFGANHSFGLNHQRLTLQSLCLSDR